MNKYTRLKKKADDICKAYILKRDPECRICLFLIQQFPAKGLVRQSVDAAHYISKGKSLATRYYPINLHGMCRRCHNSIHAGKDWYDIFMSNTYSKEDIEGLKRDSADLITDVESFCKAYIEYYKELIK